MTEGEAVQFPPAVEAAVDAMQENSMEARMRIMRERFRTLQISEEKEDFGTVDESVKVSTPTNNAAVRWEMIKKVVRFDKSFGTIGGTTSGLTSVRSHKAEKTLTKFDDDKAVALEDVELTDFFKNLSVAKPNAVDSIDDFAPTAIMPAEPTVMDISSFEDGSKTLSLTVSKVPDDVVEDYNEKVKAALAAERQKIVDELKNHEADIIWREHAAQERIRLMESAARHRTVVEKQKIAKEKLRKEKEIGQQFRRVREKLDAGIKKQHAAVKETYGHLQFHQEVTDLVK